MSEKGSRIIQMTTTKYLVPAFLSRNVGLAPKIMRKGIEASFFMEVPLNPQSLGSGNAVARGNSRYHE